MTVSLRWGVPPSALMNWSEEEVKLAIALLQLEAEQSRIPESE